MAQNELKIKVREAVVALKKKTTLWPKVAIVLGSGLGGFADSLSDPQSISVEQIPHYPLPTVPGHAGRWVFGSIGSAPILAIEGRVHLYEGYTLEQVTFPVQVAAALGVQALVVTTACGGLNPRFCAGDLMLIRDHINFVGRNPLRGRIDQLLGSRFVDLGESYDRELLQIARQAGQACAVQLQEGVFVWMSGPNYETAAEVRMLHALGGDAVSMSTVPEVIVARQRHLRVLGISLITNLGTGLSAEQLRHEDVTASAKQAQERFSALLHVILPRVHAHFSPAL
ncbi:MAG TPA: purine-nucleoside phosphorylase [bacterium]|nr:purine-nucleoside phosphorylase [bacterium]HPG44441.1 purine-nucleoside phosphorylase [bacterium]HPM96999.1 purine-nucleoside phosphorylase [bacterium]